MTRSVQPWLEPQEIRQGDDVLFTWPKLAVGIAISGIHDGDHGAVHAEVHVMEIDPDTGMKRLTLERCNLNLMSHQTRKQLAGLLNTRDGSLIDWDKAIRWAAIRAVDLYREGEPIVNLANVQVKRQRKFLIDWVIPYGQVSLFYGDGSSCKSLIAVTIAAAVQTGRTLAGFCPTEQQNVLYYDWETTEEEQADRLDQVCRGFGFGRPNVKYRHPRRRLADEAMRIRREVEEHNIGLLIIDSMHLATGNLLDFEEVARFTQTLSSLPGVTKLVLTHVSKEGAKSDRATPLGLAQINNYGRSNWEFRADHDHDRGTAALAMFHRKANNFSLQRPICLQLQFHHDEEVIRIQRSSLLAIPELSQFGSNRDKIRAALDRFPGSTADEIAQLTGISKAVVSTLISKMDDVEAVERPDVESRGRKANGWRLVAPF